jgi:hypothetical protein
MRKLSFVTLLVVALYLPIQSMAWGMLGHRIVGQIADSYLTAKTRLEIKKILGHETIAMASNWGDFIKSDSNFRYLNPWHYINFEAGLDYKNMLAALKKDTSANAYNGLTFLVKELKKKTLSKEKKLMYLRMLIHIAEDLSQPMHVSAVGSTGGNDIKLNWFSTPSNLHRVWDENLIEYQQLSYTEYANAVNFPTRVEKALWLNEPVTNWLFDSYTIAQRLHDEIKTPNPRLGYEYNFDHVELLNHQLLKGGVRLAGLLNSIFDK